MPWLITRPVLGELRPRKKSRSTSASWIGLARQARQLFRRDHEARGKKHRIEGEAKGIAPPSPAHIPPRNTARRKGRYYFRPVMAVIRPCSCHGEDVLSSIHLFCLISRSKIALRILHAPPSRVRYFASATTPTLMKSLLLRKCYQNQPFSGNKRDRCGTAIDAPRQRLAPL